MNDAFITRNLVEAAELYTHETKVSQYFHVMNIIVSFSKSLQSAENLPWLHRFHSDCLK